MSSTGKMIVATGHRPTKLGGYGKKVQARRVDLARAILERETPKRVITGMALGWDQAIAQAAAELSVPFTAVVPYRGQESQWPSEAQGAYHQLLEAADRVLYTTEYDTRKQAITHEQAAAALNMRNVHMLNLLERHCQQGGTGFVAALFDGTPGGTRNCINAAKAKRR